MDKFTILLVEDDPQTCQKFVEYIDTKEDIVLVNTTNSSAKALSDISYYMPDAVILDLELHYGAGTGLDVLSGLPMTNTRPYIIVTTNNSSEYTYEYARHLGADFIMYKHQQDYSEKNVIDFLYSLRNIIKRKKGNFIPHTDELDTPENRNKRISRMIDHELNIIGISPKSVGYKYLEDAIGIIMNNPSSNICSIVAQKHKKSEPSVERAMQYAINKAWNQSDIDVLAEHYTARITSDKGTPTITEFIYYYANKIKRAL